jgi:phosphoribosylformylglycinamidine cyclo-ligase
MPGFYADGEYDVAGFIVGAVERSRLVDGRALVPGDALIGLASSGLHTNGYSLARRIVFDRLGLGVDDHVADLGESVGAALLRSHRSYLRAVQPLLAAGLVKGMAHITGGGITDNLPRILPEGTAAEVRRGSWTVPPLFTWLVAAGDVPLDDQYRAFNMGVGLIVAVAAGDVARASTLLRDAGESPMVVGHVVAGGAGVRYV